MHPTEKEGQCEFAIFFFWEERKEIFYHPAESWHNPAAVPCQGHQQGTPALLFGGRKGLSWTAEKWGNLSHTFPRGKPCPNSWWPPQTRKRGRNKHDPSVMGMPLPLASYALLFKSLCTYLCNSRLKISLPKADKWTLCGWYYPGHSVPNALCLTTKPPVKLIKLPISQLTFFLLCSVAFILLACLHTLQEMMSDQTSNAALKRFLI